MGRSFLFVPATFEKYVSNIKTIEADKIVLDLEDSIDINQISIAYSLIKKFNKILLSKKVFARVPIEICNYKTLSFLVKNGICGFILPKVFSFRELNKILKIINKLEKKVDLILLAETSFSIINLDKLVKLSKKFKGIMFGHEDYSLDVKIFENKNDNKFIYAREKIIAVANSNNLIPIDSPFLGIKDIKGFKNYIKNSKNIGFKGVICLSPSQCKIANKSFIPDKKLYDLSKKIIKISEQNDLKKKILYHDSIFIGPPIIKQSKLIVKTYENYKKKKSK